MIDAAAFLKAKAERVEAELDTLLAARPEIPSGLAEAMRYSLFAGGKRLRPALCLGACEIVRGDDAPALKTACALEMIHTYSLVHDDLPAMDDDALRRGKPTSHVQYDEATAILVGDGLQALAFELLAETGNAEVLREIAAAAGSAGMVGGQFLDMQAENRKPDSEALRRIHRFKTGALIRASVRAGARLGGADAIWLDALTAYGEHLGFAFQIADDILDETGAEADLGKPVGSDRANEKTTYPALIGLEASRRLAEDAVSAALASIESVGEQGEAFRALARYVIDRDR